MTYESEKAIDYGNVYSVYVLEFPNGKRYVGMTRQNPQKRWRGGQGYKNQKVIYEAIEKFGWDSVKHDVILSNACLKEAGELEQKLIKEYRTQDIEYGYNVKPGGDTFNEHSAEFLQAMQVRMKGNTYCVGRKISEKHIQALKNGRTPESYKKMSEANKGKKVSEATKRIISQKAKARWQNPDYRQKQMLNRPDMEGENNPMFGKKHSDETKNKISEKALGRKASEETRASMRASAHHKKVVRIDRYYASSITFNSVREAAESVSGNGTNITFACKHPERTYKGYKWRYA